MSPLFFTNSVFRTQPQVTVLPGGAETGKRLLEDYRVAMVTFSGSRGGFGPRIEEMGSTFADVFLSKLFAEVGREVERLCRSPLGSNSNVVSVRRRCLVEVDKPGLLVVMEDMVDQVKIMSIKVPKKACGQIRQI